MKHPFTIYDLRFTIWKKSAESAVATRHSPPVTRHSRRSLQPSAFSLQPSQRGVALIITLILLSVVTFMAITFLALSRRERGAVTTVTDTAGARLAADAALANAEAQIVANVLSTTNPYNFGLLVSTNYINPIGFQSGVSSYTNVNYFNSNGIAISGGDFLQNLTNLWYSPRPPVFIPTNAAGGNDFRYYLDLNRNGRFDANGRVPNVDGAGVTNVFVSEVGDPEWIGVLERPDAPYGPNNKFIARYAFIAVPVGNTLDLNAIHNQAHRGALSPANVNSVSSDDIFIRNEGVGSWEINLAAFLADLNTNEWDNNLSGGIYQYLQPNFANTGAAFDDARALLAYRYNNAFTSLAMVHALYGPPNPGEAAFQSDRIDGYSRGATLMTGFQLPPLPDSDSTISPWSGADNTNHFFTHQELFDPTKAERGVTQPPAAPSFIERLKQAGTNVSTYDRYTFYRLLSQLGTDSTPDSGKMNLNYDNLNPYLNGVLNTNSGVAASTNFIGWTPLGFFANAADRLLRAYTTQWRSSNPTNFAATFYSVTDFTNIIASQWTTNYLPFGIGNIPVLVSNRFVYSSAVNRLLQLAANMYDATTNRYYDNLQPLMPLPTLFQPVFSKVPNGSGYNVYITNFVELTGPGMGASLTNTVPLDLGNPVDLGNLQPFNLVYGVPIIVGAKKGLPNFNEFSMESAFSITRKLQIIRGSTNEVTDPPSSYKINQMYNGSVVNQLGVECWNSYRTNYTRQTTIWVADHIQMVLTNDETQTPWFPLDSTNSASITIDNWAASTNSASFVTNSLISTAILLPPATYSFNILKFIPGTNNPAFESNVVINGSSYPQPHWGLTTTNNFQVVLIDTSSGRAIDYVQVRGPSGFRDLSAEIFNSGKADYAEFWFTNSVTGSLLSVPMPAGVNNQLVASESYDLNLWLGQDPTTAKQQIDGFLKFFNLTPAYGNMDAYGSTNLAIQAAFTATAVTVQYSSWQANDPLVHYLASDLYVASDLNDLGGGSLSLPIGISQWPPTNLPPILPNLGVLNSRYMPWGRSGLPTSADQNPYNLAYKDPLVRMSDNWDFPANKFPTVGWLGRVHRGTPWQTIFLKATNILNWTNMFVPFPTGTNTWVNWTGDLNLYDATNMAPVQDRLLFDLFTTAFNDNATRGTLSVNQTNLAAWSALFSGAVVLSNSAPDLTIRMPQFPQYQNPPPFNTSQIINPAGAAGPNSALGRLVQGINQTRATFTNADGLVGTFEHVGDILSVPQLTEQSPFLRIITNGVVVDGIQQTNGISDEMYEWLPQQAMSLLRCSSSPRYVIYCYGQALKPAPNSIVTSGSYFGMVTNYQVVSEIATRAVVRFGSALTNNIVFDVNTTNWVSVPVVTNNNAVIENFNLLPSD